MTDASLAREAAHNLTGKQSTNSIYRICLGTVLMICAVASILWSWSWPLAGDAALMHYVVFLMHHGFTPYKDIADINLPGSYLADAFAMRVFGGAVGWRLYDLFVVLLLMGAAVLITRRNSVFAGVFAGLFFLLIHLQDGIAQLGQRDLLIAALLMSAYAMLFIAQRRPASGIPVFSFGLLVGASGIIKPLFLPLGVILLLMSVRRAHERGLQPGFHIGLGLLGLTLPSLGVAVWLSLHGAILPFLNALHGLIPFHASLGHRPMGYLLTHCTAPIMPLCILWVIVWILQRRPFDLERSELLIGVAAALFAYVVQGKGYPYHRYPLLALLIVLMGIDFSAGLEQTRWIRGFAALGLASACFFFAPRAAWLVHSFDPATPFENNLAHDLQMYEKNLSGNVQCLDTFGGCINTLYNLKVVQSTGFLYDCYLFAPGSSKIQDEYRNVFWMAYERARPEIVVLTSQYCFGSDSFQKIDAWPQLRDDLSYSYEQVTEWRATQPQHWWARREFPSQYRIYLRRR